MLNQELTRTVLREIDTLLKKEVLPVTNDYLEHLSQEVNILEYLLELKAEGLISGNLITMSLTGSPHRMTNIRLTYAGIRTLHQ